MKIINSQNNTYILRLDPDDELLSAIQDFCSENDIQAASFEAVGSTKDLQLAYFNTSTKEYETKDFKKFLEIVNITGNVSIKDGDTFCHAHGTFGNYDMALIGGHVMNCVISATAEIVLNAYEDPIKRKFDEETGLYLLDK